MLIFYQLRVGAEVTIQIYTTDGKIIHRLKLSIRLLAHIQAKTKWYAGIVEMTEDSMWQMAYVSILCSWEILAQ